ncbi:MAG: NAD(P)-binding domain-containing protein [Gammaproteobacteria bacterium]|nr:NAD(P)-binding domain-containing protein [Gammaproteobacteria bacterium]
MTTEDAANTIKSIAILGGTGDLGGGLARQWSRAGYQVLI